MTPLLGIWGVGGYIPEGFLTVCSFDYLDTSPANYRFIFFYAIVSRIIFLKRPEVQYFIKFFIQAVYFLPLTIICYCYIRILHVVIFSEPVQSSKGNNRTGVRLSANVISIFVLVCFIMLIFLATLHVSMVVIDFSFACRKFAFTFKKIHVRNACIPLSNLDNKNNQ